MNQNEINNEKTEIEIELFEKKRGYFQIDDKRLETDD
jgi:hypothetical protein